jgi:hypothetical protein
VFSVKEQKDLLENKVSSKEFQPSFFEQICLSENPHTDEHVLWSSGTYLDANRSLNLVSVRFSSSSSNFTFSLSISNFWYTCS